MSLLLLGDQNDTPKEAEGLLSSSAGGGGGAIATAPGGMPAIRYSDRAEEGAENRE